jgi:hypothetical protein
MAGIRTTKVDHFAVTVDCGSLIFTTVVSEMTFHQPCLGVMRIYIQNAVNEDLRNFPSFF